MATIRVLPLNSDQAANPGPCVVCGRAGAELAYFARAY
jgi:hypothetical protein